MRTEQLNQSPAAEAMHAGYLKLTRRTFLVLPFITPEAAQALLVAGIQVARSKDIIQDPPHIWTREEKELLATSMVAEKDLDYIAYTGYILLSNAQGKPGLTQLSPLYSENDIEIRTVPKIEIKDSPFNFKDRASAGALSGPTGPKITVPVQYLGNEDSPSSIDTQYQLQMDRIEIDSSSIKDRSELTLKFLVAKEMLNMMADDLVGKYFTQRYLVLPEDPKLRDGLRVSMHSSDIFNPRNPKVIIAGKDVGDAWAQFLLIPNYLKAKEYGRFTAADKDTLGSVEVPIRYFQDKGVLIKDSQGEYKWNDSMDVYSAWLDFIFVQIDSKPK